MKFAVALLVAGMLAAGAGSPDGSDVVLVPASADSTVADLRGRSLEEVQAKPRSGSIEAAPDERELRQHSLWTIGAGDFSIRATVTIDRFDGRGAGFVFDGGSIALDDAEWAVVLQGRLFNGTHLPAIHRIVPLHVAFVSG